MVECEYGTYYAGVPALRGFNRYMVECECMRLICSRLVTLVLIDTWWNVNILTPQSFGEEQLVLIDTWWNVNSNKLGAGVEAVEF